MRMTVRRYRRRRTGSDSLGSTHSPFALPFFDRLEYLSQSINQTRKTDAPFIILVTQDNFFRSGLLSGQSMEKISRTSRRRQSVKFNGTPCRIRTYDLRLRRPLLYPTELRAHGEECTSRW